MGFQLTVFENKGIFMKKSVLHTTTPTHFKARQILRNLFGTNQANGSDMIFDQRQKSENLKASIIY